MTCALIVDVGNGIVHVNTYGSIDEIADLFNVADGIPCFQRKRDDTCKPSAVRKYRKSEKLKAVKK